MDLQKANIEEIRWTRITPEVRFESRNNDLRKTAKFRSANMKITQMFWITLQPVIDSANNLYNPKALIMLILN